MGGDVTASHCYYHQLQSTADASITWKTKSMKGSVSVEHAHTILLMEEILHQLLQVVYAIICQVLDIPCGAGFLPATVPSFFCGWIRCYTGKWSPFFHSWEMTLCPISQK